MIKFYPTAKHWSANYYELAVVDFEDECDSVTVPGFKDWTLLVCNSLVCAGNLLVLLHCKHVFIWNAKT